jgi:hypothetical protein
LAAEVRKDLGTLGSQTNALVSRSPYRAAGAATAMGIVAGLMLAKHRHGQPIAPYRRFASRPAAGQQSAQ